MNIRIFLFSSFLTIYSLSLGQNDPAIQQIKEHVFYLSSDSLVGRLTGSIGEKKAADYISKELSEIGLIGMNGNFQHSFSYSYNANPHDTLQIHQSQITGINVIGFLDNGSRSTIVIGAHYDHLGRNEHNNSTDLKSHDSIHNGADDNASGVASVLELARLLAKNEHIEQCNFLFAFFSGEEDGLMGSKAFVKDISLQQKDVLAMVNLDMVGRLDSLNTLHVGGFGTSPVFPSIIQTNNSSFKFEIDSSGVGPSDHTSFYLNNIPVLFFFTGTHNDYHKPTDDAEKINFVGLNKITTFLYDCIIQISQESIIPFTPTRNISKNKRRYKVTLGIMPDYSKSGDGLHIDGVSEGKPAQINGLQSGDIIVMINDYEIKDIYSYMECLSTLKPGERIIVKIKRDGTLQSKEIIL